MNLNIEVQLCGLFFDLILIYFIVRHETVGLYSERIFKRCIVIYTGCIVLDILSVLGIHFPRLHTFPHCHVLPDQGL